MDPNLDPPHPRTSTKSSPSSHKSSSSRHRTSQPQSRSVMISKKLSFLLRHGASRHGIKMHSGGWVRVSDVLNWRDAKSMKMSFEEVKSAVEDSDKKRFQIVPGKVLEGLGAEGKEGGEREEGEGEEFLRLDEEGPDDPERHWIRATQGHSIKGVQAEELARRVLGEDVPAKCPEYVVHGTDQAAWAKIQQSGGLKIMGRHHIHFAPRVPGGEEAVISGMRKSATVLIWADVRGSLSDGVEWWISANGVILTSGIDGVLPLKYVHRVERREKGGPDVEVIWTPEQVLNE